jgi:hypothetical protein
VLINLRAFEPDLDCVSVIDVAHDPTRFKHDPSHGMCGVRQAALRYLHAVNEDKNVIVIILVNLANGFFVSHGSHGECSNLRCGWPTREEVPNPGATEVGGNTKASPPLPGNLRTDPSTVLRSTIHAIVRQRPGGTATLRPSMFQLTCWF